MAGTASGILKILAGAAAIAAGAVVEGLSFGLATPIAGLLISAGAGEVLSGIGTMIAGNHQAGLATATRHPIAPWQIHYGECRVGGTLVYMYSWPNLPSSFLYEYNNNLILDLVFVLSASQIFSVDQIFFDQQRVPLDARGVVYEGGNGPGHAGPTAGGTSYTPVQQTVNITTIVRANDVVTVTLPANIPFLTAGDRIKIQDNNGGTELQDVSLIGTWQVAEIISQTVGSPGSVVFTYLNGGVPTTISGHGQAVTLWPSYGRNVYAEVMLGNQSLGETFTGMIAGTPWQGDYPPTIDNIFGPQFNTEGNQAVPNQWTNFCSLQGKACVFLRLTYDSKYFAAGMPQISFLIRGKSFIYDPRQGAFGPPGSRFPYTTNAALCIADFLNAGAPQAAAWAAATAYIAGNVVAYANALYIACASGTNQEPDISPNYWAPVTTNNPPVWASGTTYAIGAIVAYGPRKIANINNIEYVSLTNGNIGNEPDTSTSDWVMVFNPPTWSSSVSYGIGSGYPAGPMVYYAPTGSIYMSLINANLNYNPTVNFIAPIGNNAGYPFWTSGTNFVILPVPYGYSAVYAPAGPTSPPNIIDTVALGVAAGVCDQPVALAVGGTEPMYTCNGAFDLNMRRGEILQNLLTCCAGRLTFIGGVYAIQPGYWVGTGSPPWQVNLTAIAAGPFKWKPIVSVRDLYNGVKGTFISPANKWQTADFPYYAQDALHGYNGPAQYQGDINLAQDGGQRRWFDMHLPFTNSPSMAQRIAKIELLRRRNYGTGTFVLNLAGYQFIPLDVFEATVAFLGWSNYIVEVQAVRFRAEKQSVQGGSKDSEVVVFSIEIDLQQTNSDIYVWSTEEELSPQGYQQTMLPGATAKEAVCYPWSPGAVAPLAGDAIYPEGATGPGTFSMLISYAPDAAGAVTPSLLIQGYPPINDLDSVIAAPLISTTGLATGGNLVGGQYCVALTAFDSGSANYKNTPYLDLGTVQIPTGTTGSISVDVTWGSGDDGGDLYLANKSLVSGPEYNQLVNLGQQLAQNVFHYQQTLTSGATSATITSFNQSTPGGIDTLFDHFEIVWQQEVHSGPWAQQVQAVTSNTVTIGGGGMTLNQWADYTLSLLAYYDPELPVIVLNMPIASSTASTGSPAEFTLTIGPNSNSVQLPNLTTILDVGDLVTVRSRFTFTANSMTDANIANGYYTSGATGVEAGHLAVVLSGADIGDVQAITSVTNASGGGGPFTPSNPAVQFHIAGSWLVTPSTGDVVVIVKAPTVAPYSTPSLMTPNKTTGLANLTGLNVQNLAGQVWLFTIRTCDIHGNHAPDFVAPRRELFIWGGQGTFVVNASTPGYPTCQIPQWFSLIEVECTTVNISVISPAFNQVPNQTFTVMKVDSTPYQVIVQTTGGDTFADGSVYKTLNAQGQAITFKSNG